MPCHDPRDNVRVIYQEAGEQSARLCGVLAVLERRGLLSEILRDVDWKEVGVTQISTLQWWERHKKQDAERRQREAMEREQKRKLEAARQKAKGLLSLEERRLLGIKE